MDFKTLLMAIAIAVGTGLMYWGVLNQNRGYVAIGSLILYLALSLIEVLLISYVHSIAIGDPVMFVIFYYILDYALKMSGYIGLIFAICFFVEEVSILASIAFSILPLLPEIDWLWLIVFPYNLPPLTALCGILVMFITLAILRGKQHCNTCGARFRSPIRNVPLRLEETISDMIRSEIEKIKGFHEGTGELGSVVFLFQKVEQKLLKKRKICLKIDKNLAN